MNTINLYYFKHFPNFGDALNPLIFERVLKKKVNYKSRLLADTVGIGSLLQDYLYSVNNFTQKLKCDFERTVFHEATVCGSGFVAPVGFAGHVEKFRRKMKFIGVRGKLSRERIEKIENKKFNDVILGDLGLLTAFLFEKDNYAKKYKFGIIPHYYDMKSPAILELCEKLPNTRYIDVRKEPITVAKEILSCEIIISTAMHGLIVADSLNIPNIWITASDKIEGSDYKYRDYYSVYDIEPDPPINITDNVNLNELYFESLTGNYKVKYNKVKEIQDNLIKVYSARL